jgi:hypothetical protein
MDRISPMADLLSGVQAGRFSVLRKKHREDKDRTEWALMDSKGQRVLRWFGEERPSDERVKREERRIQYFRHQGTASLASSKTFARGTLPPRAEFAMAFELEVPDGLYSVRGPRGDWGQLPLPDGEYGLSQLWKFLSSAVRSKDPAKVEFAGNVLQTLGFEWR